MTPRKPDCSLFVMSRRSGCDELSHRVAVGRALGWTLERIAESTERSVSTIHGRTSDPEVVQLEALTRTMLAQSEAKSVEKAVKTAKERMAFIFDASFRQTELLLQKAEAKGDELTIDQLMEIHKNITVWATKYELSEAPKRMQVEGSHTHTHVHTLSLAEAENVIATRRQLTSVQERPLIAGETNVIDAEAVA